MTRKIPLVILSFIIGLSASVSAQTLDGTPYMPGKDPNIDMYFGNWNESSPRTTYGDLVERDILTRGDPMEPSAKGAVLKYINRFTHATLEPGKTTGQVKLTDEQEIYYILSGKGTIKAGKKNTELYEGICVLMPAKLTFIMTASGTEPLTMYLVNEPVPQKFRPNKEILVKDENTMPVESFTGHWCHIVKNIFETGAGLGTLERVLTVTFDPMTIGHPHSHDPGCEEVWTGLYGTGIAWLGKEIREQPVGVGYLIPPDGKTAHANINTSDEPVKMFYFARYKDHDVRK